MRFLISGTLLLSLDSSTKKEDPSILQVRCGASFQAFIFAQYFQAVATQSNASIIDARQPRVNHALMLGVATQGRVNF